MVFRLASLDLLTNEVIKRMINKFKQTEIPRLNKLYNYYLIKTLCCLEHKKMKLNQITKLHTLMQSILQTHSLVILWANPLPI